MVALDEIFKKYERYYFKIFLIVLGYLGISVFMFEGTNSLFGRNLLFFKQGLLYIFFIILSTKMFMVFSKGVSGEKYFYLHRVTDIILIIVLAVFFEDKKWVYLALLFPVMSTACIKGGWKGIVLVGYSLLFHLGIVGIFQLYYMNLLGREILDTFRGIFPYYLFVIVLPLSLNKKVVDLSNFNHLTNVFGEKDFNKLIESSEILDDSNTVLQDSNAELFTMQYIVNEVNSFLDTDQLSRGINDIILGITGASNVSLFLRDTKIKKLKLMAITSQENMSKLFLVDHINCDFIEGLIETSDVFYDNRVEGHLYPFLGFRKVGSLCVLPFKGKNITDGLILIEHYYEGHFGEDILKFLKVIVQQISLAFEKVSLYTKMHELAIKDGLTGIYNRVFFQERLKEEIQKAREKDYGLVLTLFDIDYFKSFNDMYGHFIGDQVIKHVVNLVRRELRRGDVFARYGGEEFVIIFSTMNESQAHKKVELIRKKIEESSLTGFGDDMKVTASFGMATFREHNMDEDEFIKNADLALYDAKGSGRNCVCIYQGA
jgi:diguanylate cyclase (GGDEF)-like protein